MKKINFENGKTKVNAETFNAFQANIEEASVPSGGTTGQVLVKKTNADNDTEWIDLTGGQASGDTLPIGSIIPYLKTTAPENWLICDGSAISRTDYLELFNIIGTTFGEGDGSTTFNLPNLKGRTIVGLDADDADFNTIGKTIGEKTHTLTVAEMPEHNHKMPIDSYVNSDSQVDVESGGHVSYKAQGQNYGTTSAGSSQPHNNIQPSFVTTYIIKAKQSAGIVATVIDSLESTSATDALSAKKGKELNEKITRNSTYSTEEQAVGIWIDGKTIYRKVIIFGALPNATKKEVAHNISNLEQFIKIEGVGTRQDDTKFSQSLPLVYKNVDTGYNTALTANNTIVGIETNNDRSNFNGYVILEYTKTVED